MKATSRINMLNSPMQKYENIKDSFDLFSNDTRKSGKYINHINLVSTLINDSTDKLNQFISFNKFQSHIYLISFIYNSCL